MTSITLIHGMYVNVDSWQPWLDRAKVAGIRAKTIEWPGHEGAVSDLRGSIRPELCNLNYGELVDLHAQAIGDDGPPFPCSAGAGGFALFGAVLDGGMG